MVWQQGSQNTLIEQIAKAYQFEIKTIHNVQKGYRNASYPVELRDGQLVNILLYKTEPNIEQRIYRTNAVSTFLHRRNLPVRFPVSSRILMLRSGTIVKYASVYHYLPGQTIPWEGYTKNHLKLVGMAMGTMHSHLQRFRGDLPSVVDEYLSIEKRMHHYFNDSNVDNAMERKLGIVLNHEKIALFASLLTSCDRLPHQQALHMDFVRGNLLFKVAAPGDMFTLNNISLCGILDFEKTAYGSPLFDVARTFAFLLVDCKYKSSEKVTKYFLHSGYNKRSMAASIPMDSPLLEKLTTFFLLYDFYKFLRHNPYENLHENEHFLRTKDMLLKRGVIRYKKEE